MRRAELLVAVVDGQGGGVGRALVEAALLDQEIRRLTGEA